MEIKEMAMSDIETRSLEIEEEMTNEKADIEALKAEVEELEARKVEIETEAEIRKNEINEIEKEVIVVEEIEKEEVRKKMELKELRNTKEYIDAYAEYIKGNEKELRTLLTENATDGTIAVPTLVEEKVWTDWDKSPILSRVRKSYVQGNYKVGYEKSATGAVKHAEGTEAPTEETLVLEYIEFVADYYKKWIRVSDNVLALRGEAFLNYLFDEFGHQMAIALENAIVAEIASSNLSAKVTHALDGDAVLAGLAQLSDEALNPVAIMSKATYASIKGLRSTTGQRLEDVFEGLEVLFNNTVEGVLVGDLDGVIVNFPEGMDFKYIVDEKSLAEQDLVKIVGKIMASMHLVRPNGFAVVKAGA